MHDTDGAQKPSTAASSHWPPAQCWVMLLGLWENHRVVSSFTLTVPGQSAISLHPSDYVHAKHYCTSCWQSKSFDNGAKWKDRPPEVCNSRLLFAWREI